jgi:DNA-binding response OmpR family regulator
MNGRGFAVTLEPTGRDVIDQLTRSSFEMIVIDFISIADAGELVKRIRKVATFNVTPILVIGEWGTGQPSLALSRGADMFEIAPINAARLIAAIARLPKKRAAAAGHGY